MPTLCLASLALAACDSGTPSGGSGGASGSRLVLAGGPAGYRLAIDRALSAEDVAAATSSNPTLLARTLSTTGFRGAYSRVWVSGDADLGVVAVEAGTAFGAEELQQFQVQQLEAGRGVVAYADANVPGARAFDFFGTTRQGGRQVFCQAVLFSVDAWVFTLNDCNSAPRAPDRVLAAARAEYVRASAQLRLPVASAVPSPS